MKTNIKRAVSARFQAEDAPTPTAAAELYLRSAKYAGRAKLFCSDAITGRALDAFIREINDILSLQYDVVLIE